MMINTIAIVASILSSIVIPLDSNWKLAIDPDNRGKTNGWSQAVRDNAKPVPVPGVIQQVYPHYCGVVWYYLKLNEVPQPIGDERLLLAFGAVNYYSDVYIDGQLIGSNEGAENPFEFDITGRVHTGSLLSVRVIHPGDKEIEGFTCLTVPHRNSHDRMEYRPGWCYNTGGIMLPVELRILPAVRVSDAFVKADWQTGEVIVETTVTNALAHEAALTIDFTVTADDLVGECAKVRAAPSRFKPGVTVFEQKFKIDHHRLWSIDTPNVYTLDAGGYRTRFGFRELKLEGGWFTLNGRRIYLKSAHTGNHMPGAIAVTDASTPELEYRDFQLMKAMGYNCVRFIATCATPRQLDYCDRLGLMVYQETYASWCLKDSPHAQRRYLDSIRAELKRDRNHPSITIWGAINEMGPSDCVTAAKNMLPEMRRLDPTRLWIFSSGRWDLIPSDAGKCDWQIGSASNPGSVKWDAVWGDDGRVEANDMPFPGWVGMDPCCGDLHFYPGYPFLPRTVTKLRRWGEGRKPIFISEFGVGSVLDVIDHCLEFERHGIDKTAPDYERMREVRDKFIADWKRLGLDKHFADPADFLRDSERFTARARREGFDMVRSNPRCVGYNLTGALDHALCGEGPMSLFRRVKDLRFDVFRDGWSDLRWCLFLKRGNFFCDEPVEFEAVLSDFDALRDGRYQATFAIVDETGVCKWRGGETAFTVPTADPDGRRTVVIPIVKDLKSEVHLAPGKYFLRAYLDHGGYAAAHEKEFYVTARHPNEQPLLELKPGDDHAKCEQTLAQVAAGATALVRVGNGKDATFLSRIPLKGLKVHTRETWLYHDDSIIVPCSLTAGLRTGFADWEFLTGEFPHHGFTTDAMPDEPAVVDFNVLGPKVYRQMFSLAAYRHGRGRLVLTTMPISADTPAGRIIRANLR